MANKPYPILSAERGPGFREKREKTGRKTPFDKRCGGWYMEVRGAGLSGH
jgi:hypothetical protein